MRRACACIPSTGHAGQRRVLVPGKVVDTFSKSYEEMEQVWHGPPPTCGWGPQASRLRWDLSWDLFGFCRGKAQLRIQLSLDDSSDT